MSASGLPQWKRELLQRRAARSVSARPPPAMPPAAPPAAPPPPAAAPDDDEELRYGPGIVKKLKSRYLSLALREAPRRRPSLLRRAASLEHLLEEPPPPAPPAAPRHAAPAPARRDSIKRARSVDALTRLDARDDERPPPPRLPRPPRRPPPLLADAERPPPDVVRAALRKFESQPPRRPAPAARLSAVLRGLGARTPPPPPRVAQGTQTTPSLRGPPPSPRCSTPEPRARTPSPAAADISAVLPRSRDELDESPRPVSRAALDNIARAGLSVRYSFDVPVAAANPVLLQRAAPASPKQVGVIRPMPSPSARPPPPPPPPRADACRASAEEDEWSRESTPEPRAAPVRASPERAAPAAPAPATAPAPAPLPLPPPVEVRSEVTVEPAPAEPPPSGKCAELNARNSEGGPPAHKLSASSNGGGVTALKPSEVSVVKNGLVNGSARKPRWHQHEQNTMVFNFSNRKEVPDYIENDGMILRASKRDKLKAGDPGVVILAGAGGGGGSDSESECDDLAPPSPCDVRFVNDNVLIGGRSSLAGALAKDRIGKLKLQFDDSLTRTFEYPSEASLSEEVLASPIQHAPPANNVINTNTHISSATLSSYTPSKVRLQPEAYQLGVTRAANGIKSEELTNGDTIETNGVDKIASDVEDNIDLVDYLPCADGDGLNWSSEKNQAASDLLF